MNLENEYISRNKLGFIMDFVLTFIGMFGMSELFLSAFNITLMNGFFVIYQLVICAILYILFDLRGAKVRIRAFCVIICGGVLFSIVTATFLKYSFFGLVNELEIGVYFEESISYDTFMISVITAFMVIAMYFLSMGKDIFAFAISIVGVIPCIVFDRVPDTFAAVLILAFIICKNVGAGKERYERGQAIYKGAVAGTIFVLYLLLNFIVPDNNKKSFFGFLADNINSENKNQEQVASVGISGGNLGGFDKIEFEDKKVLTVRTSVGGTVYLRGFIGNVYSDNAWTNIDDSIYKKYDSVFSGDEYNIDVYNQISKVLLTIENDEALIKSLCGEPKAYFRTVVNREYTVLYEEDMDKTYWFMPYGSQHYVSDKSEADGYPLNCDRGAITSKQYIYKYIDYDKFKTFLEQNCESNDGLAKYVAWEKEYRKFVYDVYTGVDENISLSIKQAKFKVPDYIEIDSQQDKLDYVESLQKYFKNNYRYTLEPGRIPEGIDFAQYFLQESEQGYCMHFASAATLILRDAGIPARYVEGYVAHTDGDNVTTSQITKQRGNKNFGVSETYNQYCVDVLDSNAHAWVEIYMDGYGWIPAEFTPGYSIESSVDDSDNMSVVKYEQSNLEDERKAWEEKESQALEREHIIEDKDFDNMGEYLKQNTYGTLEFDVVFKILWKSFLRLLRNLCLIAMGLAVIFVCFYVPAIIYEKKSKYIFRVNADNTPKEDDEQIKMLYDYVIKLCKFLKIRQTDDMTCASYVEVMKQREDYFVEAKVESVFYAMEKISFGHGNIGKIEMANAIESVNIVRDRSYKKLGKVKKLLYRFVWHLC